MQRLYTSLAGAALLASTAAYAQHAHPALRTHAFRTLDRHAPPPPAHATPVAQNDDRTIIWQDDFSNPANWTINHYGTEDLDWQVGQGLTGSGGAAIAPIESPTAANGYAMVDSDGHNNQGSSYESSCLTTAQPIDLSGYPAVQLQFYNQYRKWTDEECYVEVSTNNTDWATDLDPNSDLSQYPNVFKVFPGMATQAPFTNPTLRSINLTAVAGGQSQVWVRFHWTGIYGYLWFIDDVNLSTPPDNDLTLGDTWLVGDPGNYSDATVRNLEYTRLPLEQASPLSVKALVTNNGGLAQQNVVLTATINGTNYASDPLPSLAAGLSDSIVLNTGWTPSSAGMVDVQLNLSADDPNDANTADNGRTRSFLVTGPDDADGNSVMALDTNAVDGWYRVSADAANDALAVRYQIDNPGSVAYGAGFAFYSETTDNTIVDIHLINDAGDDLAFVESFQIPVEYENEAGGSHFVNVPFDAPVDLDPASDYELWIENVNTDTVSIGISGNLNPGGLMAHIPGDVNNTIYVGWGNGAPMMRLYLAQTSFVGVEEQAIAPTVLWNRLTPNPATESASMRFTTQRASTATVEVTDLLGKVVSTQALGQLSAGQHDVALAVSDLPAGVYRVSLMVGGERLTRGLAVTH